MWPQIYHRHVSPVTKLRTAIILFFSNMAFFEGYRIWLIGASLCPPRPPYRLPGLSGASGPMPGAPGASLRARVTPPVVTRAWPSATTTPTVVARPALPRVPQKLQTPKYIPNHDFGREQEYFQIFKKISNIFEVRLYVVPTFFANFF